MRRLILITVTVAMLVLGLVFGLSGLGAPVSHTATPAHFVVDGTSTPGAVCGGSSGTWCG